MALALPNDDRDLLELAPDILIALADVATLIGIRKLDRRFGILGGEFAALSELLRKPSSPSQEEKFRKRVRKLFREIERAFTWQLPQQHQGIEHHSLLVVLVETSRLHHDSEATLIAEQGLEAYAEEGRLPKLISFVRGFSSTRQDSQTPMASTSTSNMPRVSKIGHQSDYPKHVTQQLYTTLRKYAECECETQPTDNARNARRRHFSRLRLLPSRDIDESGNVSFDMLYSSKPACMVQLKRIDWQDIRFRVLSRKSAKKKARFETQDCEAESLDQKAQSILEAEFCRHLKTQYGSKICVWVHGEQLWLVQDCLPMERNILGSPSISLSTTLQIRRLSNKMKVILAYIVAKSIWEFYDSDWMTRWWSAEDIHFMQEVPEDVGAEPLIFVNKPYLSVQFEDPNDSPGECTSVVGQIHRYPRILSLGIILIEIGTGKPITTLFPDHNVNINSNWSSAQKFLAKADPWEDFDYRNYWDTARSCVTDPFLLRGHSARSNDSLSFGIEGRRNMIFENVVLPLEDLLIGTGWIHDLSTVGPIKPPSSVNGNLLVHTIQMATPINSVQTMDNEGKLQGIHIPMPTPSRPQDRRGFEIALICALPLEASAVISLFDAHWDDQGGKYGRARGDPNAYTTGRMGRHNVVVVHMPNLGKVSAAIVAAGLRTSFPHIKLALVVGVCGALPYDPHHQQEVFLGDVVISQALIQYDFGRLYPTAFDAKDTLGGGLGKLPSEIRSMLSKLETTYHRGRLQDNAYALLESLRRRVQWAKYPGAEADRLFEPTFLHQHRDSRVCPVCCVADGTQICDEAIRTKCEELGCIKEGLTRLERARRSRDNDGSNSDTHFSPSIHIGTMGSGDTVIKSGVHRDQVAKRHAIIAFEMEGAGVWDHVPSLVIKGVCDYADSHKNKKWQQYAAATAAAATKAFLDDWTTESELRDGG